MSNHKCSIYYMKLAIHVEVTYIVASDECILIWQGFTSHVKNCRERGITRINMARIYVIRKPLPCINVARET